MTILVLALVASVSFAIGYGAGRLDEAVLRRRLNEEALKRRIEQAERRSRYRD